MTGSGRRVATVDFGATEVKVEVLEFDIRDGKISVRSLAKRKLCTTQYPNKPMDDWKTLRNCLRTLKRLFGFDGIVVGIAAMVGFDGTIAQGGSLNWGGLNLREMLGEVFRVPVKVDNDAVMYSAYEIVLGVLADPMFRGRSFTNVTLGTGIGTCNGLWTGQSWMLVACEGQHNWYDRSGKPNGCNCGNYCFESAAGGSGLRRQGIVPEDLSEEADVALVSPVVGSLIAATVRQMPRIDLAVMSGHVPHKRKSLVAAVQKAGNADLAGADADGYAGNITVVRGSDGIGGTYGCLAYEILYSNN